MLKGRTGRRAMRYERMLKREEGSEMATRCWKEIKRRIENGKVYQAGN